MTKQQLEKEILFELGRMTKATSLLQEIVNLPADKRTRSDEIAAAKYLSDTYQGFENLCKRRLVYKRAEPLSGPDYHKRLLESFFQDPFLGKLLTEEDAGTLRNALRFRHRFTHGYGFDMEWVIAEKLLIQFVGCSARLEKLWEKWLRDLA